MDRIRGLRRFGGLRRRGRRRCWAAASRLTANRLTANRLGRPVARNHAQSNAFERDDHRAAALRYVGAWLDVAERCCLRHCDSTPAGK